MRWEDCLLKPYHPKVKQHFIIPSKKSLSVHEGLSVEKNFKGLTESDEYKWLKPILSPLKKLFKEVIFVSFFLNFLALAVPIFVLQVYDRVISHSGISTLQGLVIGLVAVILFDFILRQSRSKLMQRIALEIDVEVGRQLYEKITSYDSRLHYYNQYIIIYV